MIVDSDVVIHHLRGRRAATDFLDRARTNGHRLHLSVLTVTEVLGGMRSPERHVVRRFLDAFPWVVVDDAVARHAGDFRRRYRASHGGISTIDYLIGATAVHHAMPLATLNVRHFPMLDDLAPAFDVG